MPIDPNTGEWTQEDGYSQEEWSAATVNDEAVNESQLENDRKSQATAASVQDARHIGYAEVLAVYEARTDTEPLRDRRARALAVDPAQQDFTRHVNYTGQATEAEPDYLADPDAGTTEP